VPVHAAGAPFARQQTVRDGRIESIEADEVWSRAAVKRVEDVRLITGRGNYTWIYSPGGSLRAVFLRSPHAHAAFSVRRSRYGARHARVKAIYAPPTSQTSATCRVLAPVPNSDGSTTSLKPYPVSGERLRITWAMQWRWQSPNLSAKRAMRSNPSISNGPRFRRHRYGRRDHGRCAASVFRAPAHIAYDAHIGDKAKTDRRLR